MSKLRQAFVTKRSLSARCAPETVIALVRDPSTWATWQPEILSTEGAGPLEAGDVVTGRARMLGFEVDGSSRATEASKRAFEEDVVVGVRMRVRYEVAPSDDGTVISHVLSTDLPGGLAGRVLSLFLRARLKRMQRAALSELARQCEASRS